MSCNTQCPYRSFRNINTTQSPSHSVLAALKAEHPAQNMGFCDVRVPCFSFWEGISVAGLSRVPSSARSIAGPQMPSLKSLNPRGALQRFRVYLDPE